MPSMSGVMACYSCRNNRLVDMKDACDEHLDTKLVYLVIKALAKVAEYYYTSAKKLTQKNITLPHTNMLNQIPSFPRTVLQGLSIHPWVMSRNKDILSELLDGPFLTQFAELVKILTGFGKSQAVVSLDNPKVSGTQHKQLEDQQLQNKERDLA